MNAIKKLNEVKSKAYSDADKRGLPLSEVNRGDNEWWKDARDHCKFHPTNIAL